MDGEDNLFSKVRLFCIRGDSMLEQLCSVIRIWNEGKR